jgi:hypothetical protein
MEIWDKDFIDPVVPGYISISRDNDGHFQFGAVEANMDCRRRRVNSSGCRMGVNSLFLTCYIDKCKKGTWSDLYESNILERFIM